MSEKNKAVFLDRDGTINVEKHYLYKTDDFELLPGVVEGLKRLQEAGYLLIVITNQSGIGRGYYTEEDGAGVQIIGPEGKLTSIADTSTFEKDCTLYALWSLNHIHDWTYEASGNSITATCVNENCYVVDG